jgi:cytoskeletal protein CcmA (bactofilin family)
MAFGKRDEPLNPSHPEPASAPPRPLAASASAAGEPPRRMDRATIGPSIFIKGDLSGDEDLVIEGRVEGKVELKQNNVTVGKNGKVKADIFGRIVTIEGEVDGNVFAREQAILRQSGAIRGNITAPRVVLEDGSRFKGSIDMEPPRETGVSPAATRAVEPREPVRQPGPPREPVRPEPVRPEPSEVKAGV